MTAYKFSSITGEYVGTVECQENPLSPGSFLQPANTTCVAPPESSAPYIPVWDGNSWSLVEDYRQRLDDRGRKTGGTPYWLPEDSYTNEPRYMTELGPLPDDALLQKPEKPQIEVERDNLKMQISQAKAYLSDTDYAVIKCAEQGMDLESTYPGLKDKRQAKRDLINRLEIEMSSL